MYLSLKGSLGHTPITDRVGENLLQIAEGASAAYSLRNLGSDSPAVVRVRRESDNAERDFTAQDINTSALVNWVNEQITPPLDLRELTATGRDGPIIEAAAAYSLRNLSADGTSLTSTGDTQTDYFVFTGATGDTAALNGIKYVYGFPYNGAKGYNSEPPKPENTQMARSTSGIWSLFDYGAAKTYANSTEGFAEYPWEADWTGTDLENATFSQQRTDSLVTQVRRNSDGSTQSFTAAEVADGTLTDWVNTSFANALPLDTASGAAAAYSLRNLSTSYTGNVVNVRRSSDDAEESFTAAEVADGTLEDWVNGNWENVNYSTFTNGESWENGFTAINTGSSGAGLKIPSGTTGDVITISFNLTLNSGTPSPSVTLRNSTGGSVFSNVEVVSTAGSHSLTLTATGSYGYITIGEGDVPSGFSISNVVLNVVPNPIADGFVSQWYDQSGNDNHATQGTPASQPKIVDAGVLVSGGIDFDGVNNGLEFDEESVITNLDDFSSFTVARVRTAGGTRVALAVSDNTPNDSRWYSPILIGGNFAFGYGTSATAVSLGAADINEHLFSSIAGSTTAEAWKDGASGGSVSSITTAPSTVSGINLGGSNDALLWNGCIKEIILYPSDQSDKRRAIEENIGDHYGITVTSSKDGTVSTWYDQSTTAGTPNANHAVQTDAAKQPKIVDAGSLVTGGLDFDGVDDSFTLTSGLTIDPSTSGFSSFIATKFAKAGTGSAQVLLRNNNSNPKHSISFNTSGTFRYNLNDGTNNIFADTGSDYGDNSLNLFSTIITGQSATGLTHFVNGSQDGQFDTSLIGDTGSTADTISWPAFPFGGVVQEIIFYPSDQTDNRTALEANIGEVYSIAGIPAYDDTVNGFVETWYDQSGNDNDATQATASLQPKIVNAGSLLTDGITFDGTAQVGLVTGGFSLTQAFTTFSVSHTDDASTSVGIWATAASANDNLNAVSFFRNDDGFAVNSGATLTTAGTIDYIADRTYLQTNVVNGGSSSIFVDGATGATGDAGLTNPSGVLIIGYFKSGGYFPLDGAIKELIIYDSDQTSNRAALETNIAAANGVTLS